MLGMIEILQLSPLIKPVSSFFFKEKKRKARNIKYINSCAQSNLMFKIMNKGLKQMQNKQLPCDIQYLR